MFSQQNLLFERIPQHQIHLIPKSIIKLISNKSLKHERVTLLVTNKRNKYLGKPSLRIILEIDYT